MYVFSQWLCFWGFADTFRFVRRFFWCLLQQLPANFGDPGHFLHVCCTSNLFGFKLTGFFWLPIRVLFLHEFYLFLPERHTFDRLSLSSCQKTQSSRTNRRSRSSEQQCRHPKGSTTFCSCSGCYARRATVRRRAIMIRTCTGLSLQKGTYD